MIAAGGDVVAASRDGASVAEFRRAGGIHVPIPLDSPSPFTGWRALRRLKSAVHEHGIQVIHAYGARGAKLARRVSRATGVPFVVSPVGDDFRPQQTWIVREMGDAAAIVAPSEFVASLVPEEILDKGARVTIVPRGVDLERFDPTAVHAEKVIRQSQEWRADDLQAVILMPGQLVPGRGHDVLLLALARMQNRHATCLILARDDENPSYRNSLLAQIDHLQLEGRVRFVGYAPEMPAAYMIADVVTAPSRLPEAFNSSIAEALAMGRPVVASDAGGTGDLVIDGKTGWLVPAGDPETLARALDRALALNAAGRARLAAEGRGHVSRQFSLESVQQRMLALYRETVTGNGRSSRPAA